MNSTKKNIFQNTIIIAIVALFCNALWGSATPFIKIGYELMRPDGSTASTILFAGIRFFLAGILTVLIYSIGRRKLLVPKAKNIPKVLTVSLFQTILQYIFFYIGLSNTTGVKGTIISGSNAFFTVIIACIIFRQEKLTFKKVIACLLGFAGIILINVNGLDFTMNFTGDCFVMFAAISYAFSSVLMKIFSKDEDPVVISGYQFIIGGLVMILVGLSFGGYIVIESVKATLVLLYLAALSATAYSLWGVLLKHNPVSKVAIYSFTTPVFGVLLSYLMLTENSNVSPVNLIVTLFLVGGGIFILNYKKN
ncbi:MAG: DMT family transporter [Clostridia bacterium]|nr:DMT family transporter [Clostridia bacterium]